MKKVLPLRFVCSACHRVSLVLYDGVASCSYGAYHVECDGIMLPAPGHPFQVGDGVHWTINGDSYPGTVRKVSKSGLKVWISHDEHRVTDEERERVRAHGLHEGAIDSAFFPCDEDDPTEWKLFKFSTARRRWRFTDGCFTLHHGRVYSQNPSF